MRLGLVRAVLLGIGVATAVHAGACGGKVVVDLPNGAGAGGGGGQGGATNVTTGLPSTSSNCCTLAVTTAVTAVTVGPTTGTGPGCGCDQFCSALKVCGFAPNNCIDVCDQVPADVRACVCASSSCNVQACFGMAQTATSTGSGISMACGDCANKAAEGQCAGALEACGQNQECVDDLDCHQNCDWTPQCHAQCQMSHPAGATDFNTLIGCAVCQSCPMECIGSQVFDTSCFLPP